jgi:hypothetical protein
MLNRQSLLPTSCHEGQHIVIELAPVESPDVAAIANRRLIDLFSSIPKAIPTLQIKLLSSAFSMAEMKELEP